MADDHSFLLAFLGDLREIASDRNLEELARDLDGLIARHGPDLACAANAENVGPAQTTANIVHLRRPLRA